MRARHVASALVLLVTPGCWDSHYAYEHVARGDAGADASLALPPALCFSEGHTIALLDPGCVSLRVRPGDPATACTDGARPGSALPTRGVPVRVLVADGLGPARARFRFECPPGDTGRCGCVSTIVESCASCRATCIGLEGVDAEVDGYAEYLVTGPRAAQVEVCTTAE